MAACNIETAACIIETAVHNIEMAVHTIEMAAYHFEFAVYHIAIAILISVIKESLFFIGKKRTAFSAVLIGITFHLF